MFLRRQHHAVALLLTLGVLISACGGARQAAPDAVGTEQLIAEGEQLYGSYCAQCHGSDLTGTDSGPPLLHPLYAPNRTSDEEFVAAVRRGVPPTHWDLGPMPIQAIPDDDLRAVVAHVRSVQRAQDLSR